MIEFTTEEDYFNYNDTLLEKLNDRYIYLLKHQEDRYFFKGNCGVLKREYKDLIINYSSLINYSHLKEFCIERIEEISKTVSEIEELTK